MRCKNIQRFLAMALLIAFATPASIAMPMYSAAASQSSLNLSSDVRLTENNSKISLSLRDSDVRQVLRMFADKAGKNIVFHSSVDGKITLDMVDMPVNDAFNLVLQVAGLSYYVQNNTMIVLAKNSEDNAAFSKQQMMSFPVRYVSASKIANFLNANVFGMKKTGLSGVDAATVNSATNEVIVFGMPSDAAIVEKVINQLDREPLSKTFVVKHTTPGEMASMICDLLLPSRGGEMSGSSDKKSDFVPVPGVSTGGAAYLGDDSSSDSSEDDAPVVLGEGKIACQMTSSAKNTSIAPFDVQNLAISYYPHRGTITMVGGSESQIRMVEDFIRANDVKQPQAFFELSIVELNEEGSKAFENMWSINSKNWNASYDGLDGNTSGGRTAMPGIRDIPVVAPAIVNGSPMPWFIGNQNALGKGPYISWTMNYLIENKKARVLSNPKLIVTNGQKAVLDLTEDYVEKVDSEYLNSTGSGTSSIGTQSREYTIGKDLGIKVELTPFISPDGYVSLNMKPHYATIASQVTGEKGLIEATLLNRRDMDLKNVRIKDGETLVLGGLIKENDVKTTTKVPVLGDLPLVGGAFRSSKTAKIKSELVIMITPRIINDGEGSIADSL